MIARLRVLALPLVAFALAGCTEKGPSVERIQARNYREFTWWRSSVARDLAPQRWAELNSALDELRYDLMANHVSGSDAIGEALATRVNGHSVEDILRMGDELKLARLRAVRDRLKEMIDANALVGTKTDDTASQEAMERRTTEQRERLEGLVRQIAEARQQLVAHGGTPPPEPSFDDTPARLAREQARSDYRRLIAERLENGRLMYGDWPARVDRDGEDLPPELRAEFDEKRRQTTLNKHVVIPVYLRAKWRLFDGMVAYPEFSAAVTANLTPEDRRQLEAAWADSEAEIWARREARKETADTAIANIKAELKNVMRP